MMTDAANVNIREYEDIEDAEIVEDIPCVPPKEEEIAGWVVNLFTKRGVQYKGKIFYVKDNFVIVFLHNDIDICKPEELESKFGVSVALLKNMHRPPLIVDRINDDGYMVYRPALYNDEESVSQESQDDNMADEAYEADEAGEELED